MNAERGSPAELDSVEKRLICGLKARSKRNPREMNSVKDLRVILGFLLY